MIPRGYLVFHLNLAFSSIEEEARPNVIQKCYHPLLDLVENAGTIIGIEITGWTLEEIERIDSAWVERFKALLDLGKCEIIGSGYCQIIGPLAPYAINEWNQRLGIETYQKILDHKPQIVLVNEMAFTSSLVNLYNQFNYQGLIMDRDNVRLSLDSNQQIPTHARGVGDCEMPVLWSDSILFQKMQHFAHGDISIKDYTNYLQKRINEGELLFSIYCNDAEVFDYRPGRFSVERPTHPEGEWKRIEKLINLISENNGLEFISPTEALKANMAKEKITSKLVGTAYPIPVKKQAKYNIARWAVTGRNDLWLNTMCHRSEVALRDSNNSNPKDWRDLCILWSSDLRTHITDKRWIVAKDKMNLFMKKHSINKTFGQNNNINIGHDSLRSVIGNYGEARISACEEGILLKISTKDISTQLNMRRGLTMQSLAFSSHDMEPCVGTLPHGHFSSISLGADYYTGGVIIELPSERMRFTDLENVEPKFSIKDNGNILIAAEIKTPIGIMLKEIEVSVNSEMVSLRYAFPEWDAIIGSVRLGLITLLNQFSTENTKLSVCNSGMEDEIFDLKGQFDHSLPASSMVSSSSGLGLGTGRIKLLNNNRSFSLIWDPSECAVMPMLKRTQIYNEALARILFSMKEVDDTSKYPSTIGSFSLTIDAS